MFVNLFFSSRVLGGSCATAMRRGYVALLVAGTAALTCVSMAESVYADWPVFRGVGGNGVVLDADVPTEFGGDSQKAIAWKVALPGRSVGGPIVVGKKVFTSSAGGVDAKRLTVSCVDTETGKLLWEQAFRATGRTFFYPTSSNAAPTPCSDGKSVFAFYSSNDLICLDVDGNLVWYRGLAYDFPKAGNDIGMSSSPTVAGDAVIVQVECQGESFAMGLDKRTGKTLWKMPRPNEANWASPVTVKLPGGQEAVVLQCRESLMLVEANTGEKIWEMDIPCQSIPSCTVSGANLVVPGNNGVHVLELGDSKVEPKKLWNSNKINPGSGSAVVRNGTLYALNGSVLVSADLLSGEEGWKLRLPDAGQLWATPVIAGSRLYAFTQDGDCFVVNLPDGADGKGEVIARNSLGEAVYGTPAIDGNALYVRSYDHLWKIAK